MDEREHPGPESLDSEGGQAGQGGQRKDKEGYGNG